MQKTSAAPIWHKVDPIGCLISLVVFILRQFVCVDHEDIEVRANNRSLGIWCGKFVSFFFKQDEDELLINSKQIKIRINKQDVF